MARDLIVELVRHWENATQADGGAQECDLSPVGKEAIADAEQQLGFRLPALVRRMYGEVANGNFGLDYGFLGLIGGRRNEEKQDAVGFYGMLREADPDDVH